jgi:drug/metabolite transporter (DMT)-like permease
VLASVLLGLAAALGWGFADFMARSASRRIGAFRTLFFMQCFGLAGLSLYWGVAGGSGAFFHARAGWTLGVLAGVVNAASSLALYRAFEKGILAVVAPISASYPALTVLLAIHSGERISRLRAAGIATAILGVVLAAASHSSAGAAEAERSPSTGKRHLSAGVGWAIAATLGYALNFWLLGFHVVPVMGSVASVWLIRATSVGALGLVAVPAGQKLRAPLKLCWLLAGIGLLDTVAFVANNAGLGLGHVSIVTVLASLYAAVTVLLSALLLREKLEPSQWLGVFLILAGVALISA